MVRKLGDILLVLGLVLGLGSIIGYQLDIIPTLPPAVLKLVLYKLIFIGGLGLLVAGAFLRRMTNGELGGQSRMTGDQSAALNPPPPAITIPRSPSRSKDVL